jgi:hypothetical protein
MPLGTTYDPRINTETQRTQRAAEGKPMKDIEGKAGTDLPDFGFLRVL